MKVFFILDSLANSGTEKSYLKLLPYFSDNIKASVFYFYPDHYLANGFRDAKIPVDFLGINKKYGFRKGIGGLVKLINKEKPDLLVSSLLRANLICRLASKITGKPLVGTLVSDSYGAIRIQEFRGIRNWKFKLFWNLDRFTAQIPHHWIANSEFIANSHISNLGIPREKMTVIYRGRKVPNRAWATVSNVTLSLASSENNPSFINNSGQGYKFVNYGRLLTTKGCIELIEAIAYLNKNYPNSSLTLFGEGSLRPVLEEKIKSLGIEGKVFLPGNVPEVQEKLYDYDCFVFPSWYEGFSGALVEAMMAGIPIIASDIPMNLEAVSPNKNALTFPVKDTQKLFEQMEFAINHPQEMAELGKAARKAAIERFDIRKIARQYEEVLWEVFEKTKIN